VLEGTYLRVIDLSGKCTIPAYSKDD